MALIGKIRNNSWLLIFLIGLGLGGFLLMDMTSGNQGGMFGGQQTTLGSINGSDINAQEFFRTEETLYANSGSDVFSRRASLWNFFVERELMKEQSTALGLAISPEEFENLQFGANPSPIVQGAFRNPQTGQVDVAQLAQIKQAIESNTLNPQFTGYWKEMQKQVVKDALQTKMNTLVSKSIYSPNWMVESFHNDQNSKATFNYVRIPFDQVDNGAVTITDADYKAYLNDNAGTFRTMEETRKVSYISFDVKATADDSLAIRERLTDIKTKWSTDQDDSLFVIGQQGTYDNGHYKRSIFNADVADALFDAPNGTIYGPYKDGNDYKVAKLLNSMIVPDSVESRHILIPVTNPNLLYVAKQRADSIMTVLAAGTTPFETLATEFSSDQGSAAKGGDLGFAAAGRMVKPFNDMIFYQAKGSEYNMVESQFGFHIIQVTDRKFINRDKGAQIAYIREPIIPSQATQNQRYREVGTFIGEHSSLDKLNEAVAANPNMDMVTTPAFKRNDFTVGALGSGNSSRDIIKFAFGGDTDMGDVSKRSFTYRDQIENYDNKHVVAALSQIIPAGMPSVASIKDQIEADVINRAKAKAIEGMIAGMDLSAIAAKFESSVDTVANVAFSAGAQKGLGNEPKVIASAFNLQNGQLSKPISGNSAVYVVQLTNTATAGAPSNLSGLKNQVVSPYRSAVGFQLMESLKKDKDIEDNRFSFF